MNPLQEAVEILQSEMPLAIWETFYVTVIATLAANCDRLAARRAYRGR